MRLPQPRRLSALELLREWRVVRDLAASALQGVPQDLPRGQGEAVMVIPGFGATDAATRTLRNRLTQLGYVVSGWQLGRNRGAVERDLQRLLPHFDALHATAGSTPVSLVGWSLGGVIARELARLRPTATRRVITLGSPLVGGPKYTFTASWYARQGLDLERAEQKVAARERTTPLPCPLLSLYSRHDGMVHCGASIDPYHDNVRHQEVRSSHLGMCLSPEVLRAVATELAAAA